MMYAPINPSDLGAAKGVYPHAKTLPLTIGFEGSGVIFSVGPDCVISHNVGDRVAIVNTGTWAEYVTIDSDWAFPVPQNITLENASMHFINPWTVYLMMEYIKAGNHKACFNTAAASSLGKMLLRKCDKEGIKIINVVRGERLVQRLEEEGAEYILDQEDENFEEDLAALSRELGVTIGFDCVAGDLSGKLIKSMPSNSTLIVYGSLQKPSLTAISVADLLFGEKTLKALWLWPWSMKLSPERKAKIAKEIFEEMELTMKSDVTKIFKLSELQPAIKHYLAHRSEGKTLLNLSST